MIDTEDLTSYYPGYDEYCEPRENQGDEEDFDIDAIIDEPFINSVRATTLLSNLP